MLRAAIATLAISAIVAAPAFAHPPTANFTWSTATPRSGDVITFVATASADDGRTVTARWDLDGNGTYETAGMTASRAFTRGDHKVSLRATDSHNESVTVTKTVTVADAPPTGDFTWTPAKTGETVHLTATDVADPDGDAVGAEWDLNDDGTFDATGDSAETSFRSPGDHTVALRLTDPDGQAFVVRHTLDIANRAPVAAFDTTVGDGGVTLTSRASDPDGGTMQLVQAWDLDGDGVFDDATGPVVHVAFAPGQWPVALRVTDGDGGEDVAKGTVVVPAPVGPSAPEPLVVPAATNPFTAPTVVVAPSATAPAPLRAMSPFPVVRMRGRLTRRGVFVELLSVKQMPADARIAVSCRGTGCPRHATSLRSVTRELRAGAVLTIRVTAPDALGKVVRFTIRRGRPWLRYDGCLTPAGAPTTCA